MEVQAKLATALNADSTKCIDCFGQDSLRHDRCKKLKCPINSKAADSIQYTG